MRHYRALLKEELKENISKGDVIASVNIASLLGINKTKLCNMSGVNPSNYCKFERGRGCLSASKQMEILQTIQEVLL